MVNREHISNRHGITNIGNTGGTHAVGNNSRCCSIIHCNYNDCAVSVCVTVMCMCCCRWVYEFSADTCRHAGLLVVSPRLGPSRGPHVDVPLSIRRLMHSYLKKQINKFKAGLLWFFVRLSLCLFRVIPETSGPIFTGLPLTESWCYRDFD